jgi:hypothetical protein
MVPEGRYDFISLSAHVSAHGNGGVAVDSQVMVSCGSKGHHVPNNTRRSRRTANRAASRQRSTTRHGFPGPLCRLNAGRGRDDELLASPAQLCVAEPAACPGSHPARCPAALPPAPRQDSDVSDTRHSGVRLCGWLAARRGQSYHVLCGTGTQAPPRSKQIRKCRLATSASSASVRALLINYARRGSTSNRASASASNSATQSISEHVSEHKIEK